METKGSYGFPQGTAEETEAQRGELSLPRLHSWALSVLLPLLRVPIPRSPSLTGLFGITDTRRAALFLEHLPSKEQERDIGLTRLLIQICTWQRYWRLDIEKKNNSSGTSLVSDVGYPFIVFCLVTTVTLQDKLL